MAKDKVVYGLENVHVASITEADGVYTFGTPRHIPGAVNLSLDANGDKSTFYADNMAYWVSTSNNGYDGSLEMALFPDWFLMQYLGYEKDTNNVIVESASAQQNPFALLFEFAGDVHGKRHIFYYVKAGRMGMESGTTEDSIEPKTQTIDISCLPLGERKVIKGVSTMGNENAEDDTTNWSTWFTAAPTYPTFAEQSGGGQ